MPRLLHLAALVLLSGSLIASAPEPPDVVIITHPGMAAQALDSDAIRRIYHGVQHSLDGTPLHPSIVRKGPLHERFTGQILGQSTQQFTIFWRRQIFAGKASPPAAFDSESALLDFVRNTPGAIGYVDAATPREGVLTVALYQ